MRTSPSATQVTFVTGLLLLMTAATGPGVTAAPLYNWDFQAIYEKNLITGDLEYELQGSYDSTIDCAGSWSLVAEPVSVAVPGVEDFRIRADYAAGVLAFARTEDAYTFEQIFSCPDFTLLPAVGTPRTQEVVVFNADTGSGGDGPVTAGFQPTECFGEEYDVTMEAPQDISASGQYAPTNTVIICPWAAGSDAPLEELPFSGRIEATAWVEPEPVINRYYHMVSTCPEGESALAGVCWTRLNAQPPTPAPVYDWEPGLHRWQENAWPVKVANHEIDGTPIGVFGIAIDAY